MFWKNPKDVAGLSLENEIMWLYEQTLSQFELKEMVTVQNKECQILGFCTAEP